ncbi:MAG: protein-L-isoaspartate(D-aspartate) O-methyltransferase [Proteobacteria bacterium]|nr:protein-L-isoaspartate(D-aspartate) O-methyltransferase [Pseudomonadota bacterium]MBI3498893.1 protein-L-isoaspartate(D-aspartate) O-methyltransferase [Pseudomonadota bacterium]
MTQAARKIRLILELRRAGITDTRVLAAIERVPRESFVPSTFTDQAYENTALPIGHGQTISQPLVVALMTQVLDAGERMKVLEIGTGSGYQTAVLCQLARRAYSIERHRDLAGEAERRLYQLGYSNFTVKVGDGSKGWQEQAPFERIIVTAAAAEVPETLADQLAIGGIMVLPIGERASDQWLLRVRREATGFAEERLSQARFVPLVVGMPEDTQTAADDSAA